MNGPRAPIDYTEADHDGDWAYVVNGPRAPIDYTRDDWIVGPVIVVNGPRAPIDYTAEPSPAPALMGCERPTGPDRLH